MAERKAFAKILEAADGYQVLFLVDVDDAGHNRLRAQTLVAGGQIYTHCISFAPEMANAAWQLFDAIDEEQVEIMRTLAVAAPASQVLQ